jgi:hypothetical protein
MRTLLRALAGTVVALALVGSAGATVDAAEPALESEFVAGVNGVRAGAGLPALTVHGELTAVARAWADRMAAAGGISHNPNLGGQVSAAWTMIGENVGTGPAVAGIMSAFVNSSAHHANIVEPRYDHIGVGVTWGSDGRMYTAHVFMDLGGGGSAPAPAAPAPRPRPAAAPAPSPPPPAPEPPPPPAPAPPPAALAPDRVAAVLALVGALDAGVR